MLAEGHSMPHMSSSGRRFPLGSGGGPPPNGPPGGFLGSSGEIDGFSTGAGSRNSRVAPPFLT